MSRSAVLVALAVLAAAPAARAQPAAGARAEATVTQVAGQNAYLDVGTEAGLAAGDTVVVWRGEARVGLLVVVSATADRAVVAFAGEPFAITRGARLSLGLPARTAAPPEAEVTPDPAPPPAAERPSLLDRPQAARPASGQAPGGAHVTGRIQVGMDGFRSTTVLPGDLPAASRAFATPFASVRASAENLPGGLRLDTDARLSHRWSDAGAFDRPTDFRLYTLSLAARMGALDLRGGRFTIEHDPFTGAWDGASLHLGDRRRGVGLAAGLQPDFGAGLPTTDFPKAALFGHAEGALNGRLRARVQGLAGAVAPGGEGMQLRPFAGVRPQLWGRGVRVSAEAMVDRDPAGGALALSRLGARGSVEAAPGLRLSAHALRRRTYLLFGTTQLLLPPSTRAGGGLSYTLRGGPLPGATLRADASQAWAEGLKPTRSFGGGLFVPRIPGLGLSADGAAWTRTETDGPRTGLTAGASLSRAVGAGLVQVGYRFGRSPLGPDEALSTQGLDALVQLPVGRRLALTLQASVQGGDVLRSTRVYTALWYRF